MRFFFIVFYLLSVAAGFCETVRSVRFSERQAQWWIDEKFPPFLQWEKPDSKQSETRKIIKKRTYWYARNGSDFTLLLESSQSMKLNFSQAASIADWNFLQTNGSGLWLKLEESRLAVDTHSIQFTNRDPTPIVLKGTFVGNGEQEFHMKVGTLTRWLDSDRIEKGIELPLQMINLKQINKQSARDFYHLSKAEPLEIKMEPGCSFSVVTYSYLPQKQLPESTYKLELQKESGTQHYLFHTSPDQENSYEADGVAIFLNRERRLWIPAKDEAATYTLTADQDLMIRIEGFWKHSALTEASVWNEDLPESLFIEPDKSEITPLERYSDQASNNLVKDSPLITIEEILQHPSMDLKKKLRLASVIQGKQVGYRSVLPARSSHPLVYQEVNYALSRLEGEDQRIIVRSQENQQFWYAAPQTQQMLRVDRAMEGNIFLTYPLPQKEIGGKLRFQLDTSGNAQLRFQFDNETTATAVYEPYQEKYPLALTSAEVANFQQFLLAKEGTLPENFFPLRFPASLTLDIPENATKLTVFIEADEPDVYVAADYLDSNPYFPDETVYLSLLDTYEGDPAELFTSYLKSICDNQLPEATGIEKKLLNSWMPLLRLLQSRYLAFHRHAKPLQFASDNQLSEAQLQDLKQKATQAETKEDLFAELDVLGEIVHNTISHPQQQALYRISAILNQLDDAYLGTQFLKGLLLEPLPDSLRQQVSLELKNTFEKEEDYISHLGLVTSGVVRAENPDFFLKQLMDSLLTAQYDKEALLLHPFVEHSDSPEVIPAALKHEWKETTETAIAQLETEEDKQLYAGVVHLHKLQLEEAENTFGNAGHAGKDWLDSIEAAKSISEALQTGAPDSHERWMQWEQNHPGPREWVSASSHVVTADGAYRVVSTLNDRSGIYYRATRQSPLKIGLPGNTLIKVTLRPEFDSPQSVKLINGVFQQEHANGYVSKRIFRNLQVTDGLSIIGSDRGIGRSAVLLYRFPSGYHVANLHAGEHPVFFKVEYEAPVFSIPLLPKWRPNSAVNSRQALKPQTMSNSFWQKFHSGGLYVHGSESDDDDYSYYSTEYVKESLRSEIPQVEQGHDAIEAEPPSVSNLDRLTETILAFENRETSIKSVFEEMNSAEAETVDPHTLEAYRKEIDSLTAWAEINNVPQHDGLFFRQYEGWAPQSPHLRIRKALIGPVPPEARILFDDRRQAYQLSLQEPLVLRFGFKNKTIPYTDDIDLMVEATCTGKEPKSFLLNSNQMEAGVTWNLEPGVSTLQFRIVDRQPNQFLAIFPPDILNQNETANVIQKKFYRSTHERPLELRVEGPLTLRSDILHKDGRFESRIDEYPSGIHTHSLQPVEEESPWLCKVFQRSIRTDNDPDVVKEAILPPPLTSLTLPSFELAETPPILEPEAFNVQNHAWEAFAQAEMRNSSYDEPGFNLDETFYELGIEYLKGYPRRNYEFSLGLMTRFRDNGGNLTGFIARDRTRFDPINASWSNRAIFYIQDPSGSAGSFGVEEQRLFAESRLVFHHSWNELVAHTTELAIFAQYLSMDDYASYARENVDRDLFSVYKNNHPAGIGLGKRFFRQLDNHTLYGSAFLWSNALSDDFSLERVSLNLGWEGYWRQMDWDLRWRTSLYQEDDDRDDAVSRDQVRLDLRYTEWRDGRNRWLPYLRVKHDVSDQEWAGFLGLNYRWGRVGDIFQVTRTQERQLKSHFQRK